MRREGREPLPDHADHTFALPERICPGKLRVPTPLPAPRRVCRSPVAPSGPRFLGEVLITTPTLLPNLEGTPGSLLYKGVRSWGAGQRRLCSGRDTAAPRSPQPRHGVPLPFAGPQLPAAPSPHPTSSIKVHFGRESWLGLPLAPPGGSAHFAPRELSDPGRGGGFRAWPPLPPGAGWRSPRIELVGLLRRTFFSLRQPQHRARLGSGSLRAGKSPGLTPSSPSRSRRLRRGSGASGGGGEEPTGTGRGRRTAGGQSRRWGEADRSGWGGAGGTRRHPVRQGRAACCRISFVTMGIQPRGL